MSLRKSTHVAAGSLSSGMSLQNKLRVSFIVLIVVPAVVIGLVYYNIASQTIIETSGNTFLDVVIKNTQLIDRQLDYVDKSGNNLNTDEELFVILSEFDTYSDYQLLLADREVQRILHKYFPVDHLVSRYIVTHRYNFGDNASTVVPPQQFFASPLYYQMDSTKASPWIPTHSITDTYHLDYPFWNDPYVFSKVQILNPVHIERGSIQKRPTGSPDAVLVVNFSDDLFRTMFADSISTEDSFYVVSSPKGEIVSHTNRALLGSTQVLPWLEHLTDRPSGRLTLEYNGTQMLVCYSASAVTGWVSAVAVPVDNLISGVSQLRLISLGLGIFVLVLAMLLSAVLSHRITIPVKRLAEAMQKMGRGDFSQQVEALDGDELQFLTHRFNDMSREIQTLIAENYESELRKKEAQIMALDLQLNPHFLHNTLNIINMMALENKQVEISKMLVSVSKMLQYTFQNPQELVTFEQEYLWIQNYTYIMQARFTGKFRVVYEVDPALYQQKIPKLLLQPLIENAILHGFQYKQEGGLLEVIGSLSKEQIILTIRDNGAGISPEQQQAILAGHHGQIGLRNTLQRMALLYEGKQDISIQSVVGSGTEITIKYPRSQQQAP